MNRTLTVSDETTSHLTKLQKRSKSLVMIVRSSKPVTVRGELVEPLVPRQRLPSTKPLVLSVVEGLGRTVYCNCIME